MKEDKLDGVISAKKRTNFFIFGYGLHIMGVFLNPFDMAAMCRQSCPEIFSHPEG